MLVCSAVYCMCGTLQICIFPLMTTPFTAEEQSAPARHQQQPSHWSDRTQQSGAAQGQPVDGPGEQHRPGHPAATHRSPRHCAVAIHFTCANSEQRQRVQHLIGHCRGPGRRSAPRGKSGLQSMGTKCSQTHARKSQQGGIRTKSVCHCSVVVFLSRFVNRLSISIRVVERCKPHQNKQQPCAHESMM